MIEHCNNISKKLNFNNLSFIYGDVIDYENKDEIDMVISLHACNTATDIAILKAKNIDIISTNRGYRLLSKGIKKGY